MPISATKSCLSDHAYDDGIRKPDCVYIMLFTVRFSLSLVVIITAPLPNTHIIHLYGYNE